MSRIGKEPVPVPAGVEVKIDGNAVTVKGPKGELHKEFSKYVNITQKDDEIIVERKGDSKRDRSFHGLTRSLIENMVIGVTEGFKKELELHGVGYRVQKKGDNLELSVGYSHPVVIEPEEGISFEAPEIDQIIVHGIDRQRVGEVAAAIRAKRMPEPYKGKGIRYKGEYVRRKLGKAAT